MNPISLDEAGDRLRQSEARFREIEAAHQHAVEGQSTAEKVLAEIEIRSDLEEAARDLMESRKTYAAIEKETSERRRERARVELVDVEGDLADSLVVAEAAMSSLKETLGLVLALSKRRYALRHEMTGRAPTSMLGRSAAAGWVQHHLGGGLELGDLGTAPHRYRLPLAEILGLPGVDTPIESEEQQ